MNCKYFSQFNIHSFIHSSFRLANFFTYRRFLFLGGWFYQSLFCVFRIFSQSKKGLPYFKIIKEYSLVSLWYICSSYIFKSLIYLRFILVFLVCDVVLELRYYLLKNWPFPYKFEMPNFHVYVIFSQILFCFVFSILFIGLLVDWCHIPSNIETVSLCSW